MKALFTSLLLLSIVTVQANSANTDSTNTGKKTEVGPDSNPSNTASVQQLQQENSELKLKMASLETKFEDQVGLLNYKFTMSNLLAKVDEKNQLEKMVPMGVIGVIPTKVCLEGGAIKRGDLIVTSSQTGIAMKADLDKVRPGQVIGKALQEYNGTGSNKINVLVSVK